MTDGGSSLPIQPSLRKVLFLDIDGVLNTTNSKVLWSLSKRPLRQLSRVVNETNCIIVLSSTWRNHKYGFGRVNRVLGYRGLKIHSRTPYFSGKPRGMEIAEWLNEHPGVETYAIVDDATDMLPEQLPSFFQTYEAFGLTEEIADRIIAHLNRS